VIKEATSATCKELCWKIPLLRSFQIFQQKYNMSPSNVGCCFLSKDRRIRFHHPLVVCDDGVCRYCISSCVVRCVQTFLVYEHWKHKCVGVSGVVLHNWHLGSCGHPRFQIVCGENFVLEEDPRKDSTFSLCMRFPNRGESWFFRLPKNCIRYALCVVYCTSGVHFHLISSSMSSTRLTAVTPSQSEMNSWSSSID
jgi:hypothetical protein